MNIPYPLKSCAFLAILTVVTLQGCVKGDSDDAKFAGVITGKWQMSGGHKTLQFQPEATDFRPGAANVTGKEYSYDFPDDAHIRFFDGPKSHSMTYQFQVVGNKLVLKPQSGKVEEYTKTL